MCPCFKKGSQKNSGYNIFLVETYEDILHRDSESLIMIQLVLVALFVTLVLYGWMNMKPDNFPPGPPCLPLLGSIPFLPRKHFHYTMSGSWLKKYGPVVGLMIGTSPAVAVCGTKEVLQVLRRDEFQGRPNDETVRERTFNKHLGIMFTSGPFWVEQRRFSLRHLKDFGFGKKSAEGQIVEETEILVKEMKKKNVHEVLDLFTISTINVLWSMIAGTRYTHDDAHFKELLKKLEFIFRSGTAAGTLADFFPILKKIAPQMSGYQKVMQNVADIQNFIKNAIHEHKLTLEANNPRDFIDFYLLQMEVKSVNKNSTFSVDQLIIICLDLFSAGAESISNSLAFCVLYMVLYPEVQEAVQKELDSVVGRSRRPTLEDIGRLPYVEATITEVSRINSIAPITVPHTAVRDTELNGYTIRKNTNLIVNLWGILHDKEHWGDPDVFRPERFLDSNGKFVKDEWMINFGAGRRICIGEILAKNVMFLVFTTLLQEFTFKTPKGDPRPSTEALPGFTTAPAPFRVEITER